MVKNLSRCVLPPTRSFPLSCDWLEWLHTGVGHQATLISWNVTKTKTQPADLYQSRLSPAARPPSVGWWWNCDELLFTHLFFMICTKRINLTWKNARWISSDFWVLLYLISSPHSCSAWFSWTKCHVVYKLLLKGWVVAEEGVVGDVGFLGTKVALLCFSLKHRMCEGSWKIMLKNQYSRSRMELHSQITQQI